MKTIYITGATGFIGHHLVRANLAAGNKVRALVLANDPGAASLRQAGVEVFAGDIRDPGAVAGGINGADIVYHCAAVVTDWAPKKLFAAEPKMSARRLLGPVSSGWLRSAPTTFSGWMNRLF